jgi:large subunit ribosomal protein L25
LPEHLTIDLGAMVKGQTLHLDDVDFGAGIKVLTHGRKNPAIATVVEPVAEEIIVAPVASAEPAKGKKGKK